MNGVTLITCTGGRPESLARCASFVGRFDNPHGLPLQWIVVDDGPGQSVPVPHTSHGSLTVRYLKPAHVWQPGTNTLALNLLCAADYVHHDAVMFVEDDDFYQVDYMRTQLARLEKDELVGEAMSWYYHLPSSRWREMANAHHASLCQTAMRSSLLRTLVAVCRGTGDRFIDWSLWSSFAACSQHLAYGPPRVVGMKGLPGRPGIGIGHRPELGSGWTSDPKHEKLREWLGNDVSLYLTAENTAFNRIQPRQDASTTV